jgi:hypothetical protein
LPEGWLNQEARQAGFLVEPLAEGQTVLDCPPLKVVVPSLVGRVRPAEREKARYNLQRIWELFDESS